MARVNARGKARHAHADAPSPGAGCAILTVSDTRDRSNDASGDAIERALVRAHHRVVRRDWVRDEIVAIRRVARACLLRRDVDVLCVTGGTGVAPRDRTPEALAPLITRELPGFGEAFRARSWAEVGSAAWLSRAFAAIARGRLLVALPGSTAAVTLAMHDLVIPELGHLVRLLDRRPSGD